MAESAEKLWYVLHTYSGYENKVKANLESRVTSMNMENYIFQVIVPEEEEHEKKDGKNKIKMEKVFPGYVLVEMVMTDESWFVVRNTPGVTGFVGSHGGGSKPNPLMPEEVATILHSQGMATTHSNLSFDVGETITIIAGAFAGMKGKITANDPDKQKMKVTINMFEREVGADLDYDQVDKL